MEDYGNFIKFTKEEEKLKEREVDGEFRKNGGQYVQSE